MRALAGTVGVHQYLIGKTGEAAGGFWFQVNGESPDRPVRLTMTCAAEPRVTVTPAAAKLAGEWDAAAGHYTLTLSVKDGAVECEVAARP